MIRIVTESMSDFTQEEAKAADLIVMPLPIRFGMEEYWDDGVSLTAEEEEALTASWEALAEQYGGEEALEAALKEAALDRDTYMYFTRCNALLDAIMAARRTKCW